VSPPALSDEFTLIARYFAPLAKDAPLAFGLADDAAALRPRPGFDLIVTTDCMVSGVHFLDADGPANIARKLLRVNLSDLAAKGARPLGYLLAAAFPRDVAETWIAAFAAGLAADQLAYGLPLLGGDTAATPGPATLTITAIGELREGTMLRRFGAQPGDSLWVSGTIGDGALGLAVKQGRLAGLGEGDADALLDRLHLPEPRLGLGQGLIGLASACLDVSDGLVQDVGHLATASGVACEIDSRLVPLSPAARRAVEQDAGWLSAAISGGDDYELAFTLPPGGEARLAATAKAAGVPVTRIGRVSAGKGVRVLGPDGRVLLLRRGGYRHF
jgi:thiamine-monophosphate kinase